MSLLHDSYARPRMPSPSPTYARAINISARPSPALTASCLNGSLQSTPEGMVPISSSLPAIPSYALPESLLPAPVQSSPTSSPSAMAEALGKGPNLIRRVSRGAQGIPHRFRRGNSTAQRDKSSGPVIMRRRSDSRTAADGADTGISDFDAFEEEEAIEVIQHPLTLETWKDVLTTDAQNVLVFTTGGNNTCFGLCENVTKAWNVRICVAMDHF